MEVYRHIWRVSGVYPGIYKNEVHDVRSTRVKFADVPTTLPG